MPELIDFWPTGAALSEVLASQAEGHGSEAFLAVHQPMRFSRRPYGGSGEETRSEDDLLKSLLRDSADGAVIVPVFGRSGVGKSHAIRWIYERLLQRSEPSEYVLVWVSRTQAAKSILVDLLSRDEFSGPEWDDLQSALQQAQDGLSLARASMELRTEMAYRLKNEPPADASKVEAVFIREAGPLLASFIEDPNVWAIPSTREIESAGENAKQMSPWIRLCEQLVVGGVNPDDEGARRFVRSDLDFPPSLGDDLGATAQGFWQYLQVAGPIVEGLPVKEVTLDVLNRVLDGAQSSVLGLGSTPVSELFIEARRKLYGEGKELVLLIEDLTLMTGLQGSLLDVMVQPSSAPAGDRLCAIRTALALTPGFGGLRDNVMTRAKFEWWVEDRIGESEVLERYEALTASYLNAARWVQAKGQPSSNCFGEALDERADEVGESLRAFGKDPGSGRHLFPFNQASIAVLARRRVHDSGQLVYNPRRFLNTVLETVVQRRESFLSGRFPGQDDDWPTVQDPTVATRLLNQSQASEHGRILAAVATWGGQPSSWSDVEQMPEALFTSFGLTPPDGAGTRQVEVPPPGLEPGPESGNTVDRPAVDPLAAEEKELGEWRANQQHQLSQTLARDLRKAVAQLVGDLLPTGWPGLPSYRPADLRKHIYIHRALGNNQLTAKSALVALPARKPGKDSTAWVRYQNEMIAVLRWYRLGADGFDYFGAKESLPFLFSLLDRVHAEAAGFLRTRTQGLRTEANGDSVKSALSLQLLSTEIHGGSARGPLENRLADLFGSSDGSLNSSTPSAVRKILRALDEVTAEGGSVRTHVLEPYGAFQGRGTTPLAVDAPGLIRVLKGVEPGVPKTGALNAIQQGLADRLIPSLRDCRQWYDADFDKNRKHLLSWFGEESPTAIRDQALALADQALAAGHATAEAKAVRRLADDVDGGRARSVLSQLESFGVFGTECLPNLAGLDWETWILLLEFVGAVDAFLDALEPQVNYVESAEGEDLNAALLNNFDAQLDRVRVILESA